jgi:uroporphyrinogen III methyltransferase / synthase
MKDIMRYQKVTKVGTRKSKLAIIQADFFISKMKKLFPALELHIVTMLTPGDKDKISDLRSSSENFFTKDLDDAVISGRIDCAVHSAKDLPQTIPQLDFFYLPWREDRRDVLVYNKFIIRNSDKVKIGVSSKRRETYCCKRFPNAELLSVRGNIEERLQQLDKGKYEIIVTAAAALNRLNLKHRISEYISLADLEPPEAQGSLAVAFRKGNKIFSEIRKLFIHPVIFASAGIGSVKNITIHTLENLKSCDVCLYDALCPTDIEKLAKSNTKCIFVGKRKGKHTFSQDKISNAILDYQRQGKRVLRLKGGDIAFFSRLPDEIETLSNYDLPYRTYPGVTSLSVAALASGFSPTRRGIARGFTTYSLHRARQSFPDVPSDAEVRNFTKVIFMGISAIKEIVHHCLFVEHMDSNTPVSVILNAGINDQKVINSTLSHVEKDLGASCKPGIIFIGGCVNKKYQFRQFDVLKNETIIFTGSEKLSEKAIKLLNRYCPNTISMPTVKLPVAHDAVKVIKKLKGYTWLIISSPNAAEIFINLCLKTKFDLRHLPKIIVGGPETAKELSKYGIFAEICPSKISESNDSYLSTQNSKAKLDQKLPFNLSSKAHPALSSSLNKKLICSYGSVGIVESIRNSNINKEEKILRLSSDRSSPYVIDELKKTKYNIDEFVLYHTVFRELKNCPEFTSILFCSSSAIESFVSNFGEVPLKNKNVAVIGVHTEDTAKKLKNHFNIICPQNSTLEDMIFELALYKIRENIKKILARRRALPQKNIRLTL